MTTTLCIDLNADLGEGCGDDEAILACVSSANIACGGHAGDLQSMQIAVAAAARAGVHIGAHPSFPDRANFGRTEMQLDPATLDASLRQQILALRAVCQQQGQTLHHVKPHGALYNQAARDEQLAHQVVALIQSIDASLIIYGLAGGAMADAAQALGMRFYHEGFADRRYTDEKQLVARHQADAIITDTALALQQALRMAQQQQVISQHGQCLSLQIDTLCLHGDGPHALALAQQLAQHLRQRPDAT